MSEQSQDPPQQLEIPDKKHFKIGEVADILGVKPYILRYWEIEFRMVSPKKTSGRHRMYTRGDIELLATIKSLLYDQMCTIAGARKRLEELAAQQGGPMSALFSDTFDPTEGLTDGDGGSSNLELTQLRDANRALREQLEEAEENIAATSSALHEVQVAHNDALAQVSALEHELEETREDHPEIGPLRADNAQLNDRIATLEGDVLSLETEVEALREALDAERAALREARTAAASLKASADPDPQALEAGWREQQDS